MISRFKMCKNKFDDFFIVIELVSRSVQSNLSFCAWDRLRYFLTELRRPSL